jgi:hypothetical protein
MGCCCCCISKGFQSEALQLKLRSKFLARPGLLKRHKGSTAVIDSEVIDEEADDDASSSPGYWNLNHDSVIERAIQLAEQGAVSFNDAGGVHYSLQQPIPVDCVYITPKEIEGMSDHYIIFVWNRNFAQIIEFLRLRLLSAVHSILLITDQPLSPTQWFLVGRFVGIKILVGNCSNTQLLVHAGAERCLGIVVLPQQPHSSTVSASAPAAIVVESASILIYNMAKKLKNNVCCFIEVAETRSFGFLSRDESLFLFGSDRSVAALAFHEFLTRECRNLLTGVEADNKLAISSHDTPIFEYL